MRKYCKMRKSFKTETIKIMTGKLKITLIVIVVTVIKKNALPIT